MRKIEKLKAAEELLKEYGTYDDCTHVPIKEFWDYINEKIFKEEGWT